MKSHQKRLDFRPRGSNLKIWLGNEVEDENASSDGEDEV